MPNYNATSAITPWTVSSDYRVAALSGNFTANQHHVWQDVNITYSFPDGPSYFNDNANYGTQNEIGAGWSPLTAAQKDAVRAALKAWEDLTIIRFIEVDDDLTVGDLRFAITGAVTGTKYGHAYSPAPGMPESGDVWLTSRWAATSFGSAPSQTSGAAFGHATDTAIKYQTLMHEIGHALGLSHPHVETGETRYTAPLPLGHDHLSTTVMSYAPWAGAFGAPGRGIPTTPMPYDILAIQHMYGTNLNTHRGDTTYRFDIGDVRLETLYDTGGVDTLVVGNRYSHTMFDSFSGTAPEHAGVLFRGYRGVQIDLRPGAGLDYLSNDGVWGGRGGNMIGFMGDYAAKTYTLGVPSDNASYGLTYINSFPNIFIAFNTWIENAVGSDGNDKMVGNVMNNRFTGGGGSDRIDGMEGTDTAVYAGAASTYSIIRTADGHDVRANFTEPLRSWQGTTISGTTNPRDILRNVERLEFSDQSVALDLAVTQSAGKAARIVGALLDTSRLTPEVAGIAIRFFDQGMSMQNVAKLILDHPVYLQWAGSSSHVALITTLFRNIANQTPSTAELQHYNGLLERGELSQSQLAVLAAESSFNESNIDLVGLQTTGLVFTPYLG